MTTAAAAAAAATAAERTRQRGIRREQYRGETTRAVQRGDDAGGPARLATASGRPPTPALLDGAAAQDGAPPRGAHAVRGAAVLGDTPAPRHVGRVRGRRYDPPAFFRRYTVCVHAGDRTGKGQRAWSGAGGGPSPTAPRTRPPPTPIHPPAIRRLRVGCGWRGGPLTPVHPGGQRHAAGFVPPRPCIHPRSTITHLADPVIPLSRHRRIERDTSGRTAGAQLNVRTH